MKKSKCFLDLNLWFEKNFFFLIKGSDKEIQVDLQVFSPKEQTSSSKMVSSERNLDNIVPSNTKANSLMKTSSTTPTNSDKLRSNLKDTAREKDGISNYFVESGNKPLGSSNITPSRRGKVPI